MVFRKLPAAAMLCLAALVTTGCDEPDGGEIISGTPLPTDTVLDLACRDVGIGENRCVLDDPENPFRDTVIVEFDVNNEDAFNKFILANSIPPGPSGAKSRFYFWATALARRGSGENQWNTARALHEVWDAQIQANGVGDDNIRDQALRAYRSVLDNFFGSVTFFTCFFREGFFVTCDDPSLIEPDDVGADFPNTLNELAANDLFDQAATGFERLVPTDDEACRMNEGCSQLFVLELFGTWGYTYNPNIPLVTVNGG